MKGLLIKDASVLVKKMKLFAVLVLVFGIVPDGSFLGIAVMYSALLPITAFAYDESSKWDELAAMMPYSVFQLTFSKYLLGYCITLASAAATFALRVLIFAFTQYGQPVLPAEMLIYICISLSITALMLPAIFRFGAEKGRYVFMLVIVVAVIAGVSLREQLITLFSYADAGSLKAVPAFLIAALVINAVSVPLSEACYRKRYR